MKPHSDPTGTVKFAPFAPFNPDGSQYTSTASVTKLHVDFEMPTMEPPLDSLIDAAYTRLVSEPTRPGPQMADAVAMGQPLSQTAGAAAPYQHGYGLDFHGSAEEGALVDRLLRSRKIGRPPKGRPLSGVYLEMRDRLRTELRAILPQSLEQYYRQRNISTMAAPLSARDWSHALIQRTSQNSLEDAQLKRLALEAQSHPPQTHERQHALMQLVEGIRLSGRLARPHRTQFSPQFYELLYEEAVNRTLTYVCRRIETYDPNRGKKQKFMNWVNFRLDRMIIECRREFDEPQTDSFPTLEALDLTSEPYETESLADRIRECIATDAEQVFAKAHIRHHPNASFQAIALARFDGKSWDDISRDLGIKVPTLSSFFQRCCQKFAPIFHACQ